MTGLYHRIILQGDFTESYYGIILRNQIMESYYGITLWNPPYERNPRDAQDVPRAPWDPGDPVGTPLGPQETPLGA